MINKISEQLGLNVSSSFLIGRFCQRNNLPQKELFTLKSNCNTSEEDLIEES